MQNLCLGCMKPYQKGLKSCPYCGYTLDTKPTESYYITPGMMLKGGRYVVGRALGSGGFGVTYIGYDLTLSQVVAIKEYLPGEFATREPNQTHLTVGGGEKASLFSEGKKSFIDESRKLMKFQDVPEIVHVFDCFEDNKTAYIVMEYLDGETLRARIAREKRLSPQDALPITLDVLHALEKIHSVGMLHRDVAPDNIFLTKDGKTKLIDFGAARFTTMEKTKSLTVMLKPGFAPPEQYASKGSQGPWTDVYATAATLYCMLTGTIPEDAMERFANDTLRPPRKMGVKISKNMENALLNALQVKAEKRTQTAKEFEEQLESSSDVQLVSSGEKKPTGRFPLWVKLAAALGALCVAVLVGLITYVATHRYNPITGYETERNGQVIVPDFLNMKESKAQELADRRGLKLQFTEKEASGWAIGLVMDQPSGHGQYVDRGTSIDLVLGISNGKELIPDVRGLDADAAIEQLKSRGFEVQTVSGESIAAPGTIAEQSFHAGEEANTGSVIVLTVSTGMEGGDSSKVEKVEDLTGMTYEEAASNAYDNHKHYIVKEYVYDDEAAEGTIVSQDPPVDSSLRQNEVITVKVSMGKAPSVVNYTEEEAVEAFEDDDAVTRVVVLGEESSSDHEKGRILRQELRYTDDGGVELGVYVSSGVPEEGQPGPNADTDAREETTSDQRLRETEGAIVLGRDNPATSGLQSAEGSLEGNRVDAAQGAPAASSETGGAAASPNAETVPEGAGESSSDSPNASDASGGQPSGDNGPMGTSQGSMGTPERPGAGGSGTTSGSSSTGSGSSGSKSGTSQADPDSEKTYKVRFSTKYGSAPTQTVAHGDYAEEPVLDDTNGYSLSGWYSNSSLTKEWDFSTEITRNITLYAKWEKINPGLRESEPVPEPTGRATPTLRPSEPDESRKSSADEETTGSRATRASKESEEVITEAAESTPSEVETTKEKETRATRGSKEESESATKATEESTTSSQKAKEESEAASRAAEESKAAAARASSQAAEEESRRAAEEAEVASKAAEESKSAAQRASQAAAEESRRASEEAEAASKAAEESKAAQRAKEEAEAASRAAAEEESRAAQRAKEEAEAASKAAAEEAEAASRAAAEEESRAAAQREKEEAEAASKAAAEEESRAAAQREREEAEAASKAAAEEESRAAQRAKEEAEAASRAAAEEERRAREAEAEIEEEETEDPFDVEQGLVERETRAKETTAAETKAASGSSSGSSSSSSGKYTVTFNANGRGVAPAPITANAGSKPALPVPAAVSGYQFAGWYKDALCTRPWNAAVDTITGNTVLFAKWVAAGSGAAAAGQQQEQQATQYVEPDAEAYTIPETEAYFEPETEAYREPETTAYRNDSFDEEEEEDYDDFDEEW